jgi:NAD(P) transhydrogenase subunit alpha
VLITRVPSTLHTPLMSATNMISGIVLLGAMMVIGRVDDWWLEAISFLALAAAAATVVGGFWVTNRMLRMFTQRNAPNRAAGTTEQRS